MDVFTALDVDGQPVTLALGQSFITYAGGEAILHPANALALYGAADLARFGITHTVEADPEPPAVRRELPKSTVTARVDTVGKLPVVFGILNSQPSLFAKWFSPDWPNVYVDDAGLLQVLAGAGLSAEEIAQVVA